MSNTPSLTELHSLASQHTYSVAEPTRYVTDTVAFARAIEAEVRKQDDELIQQLEEALTDIVEAGEEAWGKERPCVRIGKEAITAARARLENT